MADFWRRLILRPRIDRIRQVSVLPNWLLAQFSSWLTPYSTLEEELRAFLQTRVPDYMVPRHFVFLESLPLNSSGKIDKARLPKPESAESACDDPVLRIFRTVLEDREFMPQDSFLEAGGSSIMAARLIASLREYSGIAVPFSLILEPQTATRASLYIENARLGQHQEQGPHPDTSEITARI